MHIANSELPFLRRIIQHRLASQLLQIAGIKILQMESESYGSSKKLNRPVLRLAAQKLARNVCRECHSQGDTAGSLALNIGKESGQSHRNRNSHLQEICSVIARALD